MEEDRAKRAKPSPNEDEYKPILKKTKIPTNIQEGESEEHKEEQHEENNGKSTHTFVIEFTLLVRS